MTSTETPDSRALSEAVDAGFPAAVADLSALVRIPSIAWDGFDHSTVRASAEAVAELARGLGVFDLVEVRQSTVGDTDVMGQPAVIARRAARNGKPTVLMYAHHDVQPVGDGAGWESSPFEPTLRGDRLYGRGAADDKAGILMHIAAIRSLVEVLGTDFDLGLALFIEGEEEFGSRSFARFLHDNQAELAADVIIVGDSGNWDVDTPALTVGLRGAVAFKLTVSTLDHALHSGMFGGAVPDAMLATIRLLDSFWKADGSVAVEGMLEREAETPPYDEQRLREESGLPDGVSTIGSGSELSRLWNKPSITVTGIDAPTVQNASNTLIPSVTVKVSARVAPGQTAADAFAALERHVRANAPFGATIEIDDVDPGDAFLVDTTGWAATAAEDAMHEAWGTAPVEIGVGGSIPFIADLVQLFPEAQILVTGVEDPDSRAHSPNESLHLPGFRRSILTEALLLRKLEARA